LGFVLRCLCGNWKKKSLALPNPERTADRDITCSDVDRWASDYEYFIRFIGSVSSS
jgi:hypothetical protein